MPSPCFNFNNTYLHLPQQLYVLADPVAVSAPELVIVNHELATSLGIPLSALSAEQQAAILSGNQQINGMRPFCQAYAGHQYAHFTMLGDGRAHLLGEHMTPAGARVDVQLKGSGPTPYSRGGDGRAALSPMLREYIISEAMFALGIPTTRSLAVVTSGEKILRQEALPGAILTRIAGSHLRIGTFEYAATQADTQCSEALLTYTLARHFPELQSSKNKALSFLNTLVQKQAELITHWMRVGFIHGVMNTDNVSICGETIDYGPCAFMDEYNPSTVFSYIDKRGRYAYGKQPHIAQWNLARLAESLLPLIHSNQESALAMASEVVNEFSSIYHDQWLKMMRSKLGLVTTLQQDERLINDLLNWMQQCAADYTNTFAYLTYGEKFQHQVYAESSFQQWYQRWQERLTQDQNRAEDSIAMMKSNNPAVIPRNHVVENVLASATQGNVKSFHALLQVLKKPYQYEKGVEHYQSPPQPCERVKNTFCGT
jgi:serine/tyrosine/threonine adenylyltransferase